MTKGNDMKVFAGSSNLTLAQEIAGYLDVGLGNAVLERFSDGEIHFYIDENVRGADVFVIQTGAYDANINMMELFIMIDAFKRASAERITAVIPYYSYARQDWKDRPRVPISARLLADLLEAAGANRVLTMDLHSPQIQGFFSIPVDNLIAGPVLADYIESLSLENLAVVSPDAGGVSRARWFAKRLKASLAIIDKRRPAPNIAKIFHVIGEVEGRDTIIVDDMVDTGGTLVQSVDALKDKGARKIFCACSHPVLSGEAKKRIQGSKLEQLIVTNTIPMNTEAVNSDKFHVLSVAGIFGEAIKRIHQGLSVSGLFS